MHVHFEIVFKLTRIYFKTLSVCFVGNAISNSASKDQTTALHMVIHNILKFWSELSIINKVKEDLIVSGNVDSDVSFDKVKQSFVLKLPVLFPVILLCFVIPNSLEEQNIS